jgi:hypothetical protein
VDALLREHRAKHGITARAISDEEIVARCFLPLINEGFKVNHNTFDSLLERVVLACLKCCFTTQIAYSLVTVYRAVAEIVGTTSTIVCSACACFTA